MPRTTIAERIGCKCKQGVSCPVHSGRQQQPGDASGLTNTREPAVDPFPTQTRGEVVKVETDYRALLLSFIGSLTLCDHMGDVSNDVGTVLDRIGVDIEWEDYSDLGRALGKMGVRTLYDTELAGDDDDA